MIARISTPTISRFESGRTDIELTSVLNILNALGMTDRKELLFFDNGYKYEFMRGVTYFRGKDNDKEIICGISQEALDDFFQGEFKKNRKEIEHHIRRKYLNNELEPDGSVIIRTNDLI